MNRDRIVSNIITQRVAAHSAIGSDVITAGQFNVILIDQSLKWLTDNELYSMDVLISKYQGTSLNKRYL